MTTPVASTEAKLATLTAKIMSRKSMHSGAPSLSKTKSVDLGNGVELTEEMIAEFRECFNLFDKSGDGSVSADEVGEVMTQLGLDLSQEKLAKLVAEVDQDGSGELEFPEFIQLMARQMMEGTEEKEFKQMFLMISGGSRLVPVVTVRSLIYKITCLNPDTEHQITVTELQELFEEAMGTPNPSDHEVVTFSQFKRMLQLATS